MMKFAVNHPWKFRSYKIAFFVGFAQLGMGMVVESATCLVLLFASDSIFDVLANYIIVLVIADFGGNFYKINSDERNKKKLTDERYADLTRTEVSTSHSANHRLDENRLASENILPKEKAGLRPEYIYMAFLSRDC